MELRQLNTFMTIAKHLSFSKAANELGYAQSSVTSQIKLLEQELKVRLFERLGHTISLTHEGDKLMTVAKQILKLTDEAKSIASNADQPSGPLIIGAVESLCVTRLPKLLKEYRSRYPNVEISLKFGTKSEFIRSLKDNTIDIAFFVDKKMSENDLIAVIQTPEPMVLLCLPEHAYACKDSVYPEDLSDASLILTEIGCGYRVLFDSIISQYNVKPRSLIETSNVHAIKQLLLSGMGIAFLPQTAVDEELSQNKIVRLKWKGPEFLIFTQVFYYKNKWISPALKAFIELMKEMNS